MEKVTRNYYIPENEQYEAIKIIEAWKLNFSLGNVLKYILRSGRKTTEKLPDLYKAMYYLQREIDAIENKNKLKEYELPF